MEIEDIFKRADQLQESGMDNNELRLNIGLDILHCMEESKTPDAAVRILFNMFDRYK